ncbi:FAD-binding protein [Marivita sp. XM-24bin2]|jgi:glycolate oxidase FAD binding subunit|uniref:FAD-binding protein n=1 Tax=unclassified Marivita TaxID=2632480 RepID=UPI000D7B17AB|nr:FAD-binding protein [Marivita sp. XM-24bin2]MCR9109779.1 FAD-binding protein [Paracoccaceae bacterium]PWL36214.1 MAG: 2-hydroxy-acid oxidase [Marivita sp. XM-24bin2]
MRPETEAELADMIASASAPICVRGGGTRGVHLEGGVLETGGLSGITLYEPGSLTLVAQAGTPLAEIEAALDAEGQRLAFEPMDQRGLLGTSGEPTIGGVVAANISGPRRVSVGACRDFMLGVRYVDGAGAVVKNGGRVMKNVTGYDLVKLMSGSWGTLGVLTEVSLKVLPKPETAACVLIDGLSDADAVQAMAKALGSPFEVSGAAHIPAGLNGHPVTMLRLEGFAGSVAYRADQVAGLFGGMAVRVERDPDAVAKGWAWVRDVDPFHAQPGDVWRVSCTPTGAAVLASKLGAEALLYDWGGGLIWARVPEGTDLRSRLGAFDGHATLVRGSGQAKFQPDAAPIAALSRGLRARFDPKGILNTGLMG